MARNLRIWILQYTEIMTSDLEGGIPIFFFRAQAPLTEIFRTFEEVIIE